MDEYEERTLSVIAPEQQVRIAGCTDHHTSCAGFFLCRDSKSAESEIGGCVTSGALWVHLYFFSRDWMQLWFGRSG